ncbi:MAG: preprotein translocase subunit SecE [Deltaproteobacteria bacterium]|nr:preprotein translocase subunit SecE [Deltaproteobacteria bacterium]
MPNLQKWVNLSFLICGVLGWIFLRGLFALAFEPLGWNRLDWFIAPSDVAGIISGLVLFLGLVWSPPAGNYLAEVISELGKVTWPARKETVVSTGVVIVMLTIATVFVMLFDTIWVWVVDTFLYT